MTCPLPGKCVHDRVGTKGEHSCTAGRCPHARLVRMALGEQIQAICRKGQRTEREEERLERLKKELARSKGMLSNEKFLSKAPEAKVLEEKEKLAKYEQMMQQVEERLSQMK